jgi:hypothetical protein
MAYLLPIKRQEPCAGDNLPTIEGRAMFIRTLRAMAAALALLVCASPSMAAGPIVYHDFEVAIHNNNDHGITLYASMYSALGTDRRVELPPRQWTTVKYRVCCDHEVGVSLTTRSGTGARYHFVDPKDPVRIWVDTLGRDAHPDIPNAQNTRIRFYGNFNN